MCKRSTSSHCSHRKWVDRLRHFDLIAFYEKKIFLLFIFFIFVLHFFTQKKITYFAFLICMWAQGWTVYTMWVRENSGYIELLVLVTKGMGRGCFPCHPDNATAAYTCLSETLIKLREAKAHQTWTQAGALVCAVWTSDRSGATCPQ